VPVVGAPTPASYVYTSGAHIHDHIVRVGVNYRFGG
jgi:hypothetical protein